MRITAPKKRQYELQAPCLRWSCKDLPQSHYHSNSYLRIWLSSGWFQLLRKQPKSSAAPAWSHHQPNQLAEALKDVASKPQFADSLALQSNWHHTPTYSSAFLASLGLPIFSQIVSPSSHSHQSQWILSTAPNNPWRLSRSLSNYQPRHLWSWILRGRAAIDGVLWRLVQALPWLCCSEQSSLGLFLIHCRRQQESARF